MPQTEADTCRMYVLPNLYGAGWTEERINEQHAHVVPNAKRVPREPQNRAGHRLRGRRSSIGMVKLGETRP